MGRSLIFVAEKSGSVPSVPLFPVQYEIAEAFSKRESGAEEPLAVVRQLEWIDEPERGRFIPVKKERITEWQVAWLPDSKRTPTSIEEFMKHPREAGPP
jgi:hypothetical protein